MEIVKKLNIPAPFFYEKVIDSVLFDIRKHTGKSLTKKQLDQFEYVKQFSKNSRAKIKIKKIVENSSYHFQTSTTKNNFNVEYNILAIDDKTCEVHYQEKMESFGTLQKLNDAVLGMILGYFKKRQFKQMLENIQNSY